MNLDQERTDELINNNQGKNKKLNNEKTRKQTTKKKTKSIGIIAGAIALIIIVALVVFIPKQRYNKQLDLAAKYLDEGNYDEAILAYDNAIEISSKNPEAFEGKAEAYIASGDFKSAQEVYSTLYDLTGVQKYQKEENAVGMSNTSGNLVNGGYVLTDDDGTIYEANNPKPGSVTKVEGDNKTEILTVENDNKYSEKTVMDLNVYKGWIYYRLVDGVTGSGTGSGIYRMKLDGSENECIFEKPEGNNIANLILWGNKLYFAISNTRHINTNELSVGIYTLAIDREGKVEANAHSFLSSDEYRYSALTCDGQNIYALAISQYANGVTKVAKITPDGTQTLLSTKTEYGRISNIIEKDDKLFCIHTSYTDSNGYASNLITLMNKDGSNEQIVTTIDSTESVMGMNVDDDNMIYFCVKGGISSTKVEIQKCKAEANADSTQIINDTPTDQAIGYKRETGMSTYANTICFAGDKLYYTTGTDTGEAAWTSWFSANKDGSDIQPMLN